MLCIGLSSIEDDELEIDLKIIGLKVDQKNLRLVNLTGFWAQSTHPVEVSMAQLVTPWKLSWEIPIRATTMMVRRLKRLNNQTKFDCTKQTGRKLEADKVVEVLPWMTP